MVAATQVTYLSYGSQSGRGRTDSLVLPFQTSQQIQDLVNEQASLEFNAAKISSDMPNLTSLAWIGWDVDFDKIALLNLQKLQKLRIHCFAPDEPELPVLSYFTALQR